MQQHPIPQNITSYQFRLIGDMTLKQFFQLLGGGVVAFIFFSTNLPGFIKWFFVIISLLMGAAFAFLPLEGRPLDKWLLAFIRAIYKPTQFHWKKEPKLPDYLSNDPVTKTPSVVQSPKTSSKSIPKHEKAVEKRHSERVDQITKLFSTPSAKLPTKTPTSSATPQANPAPTAPPPTKTQTPSPVKLTAKAPTTAPIHTKPVEVIQTIKNQKPTNHQIKPSAKKNVVSAPIPQPTKHTSPAPQIVNKKPTTKAVLNPDLPFPSLPETKNTLLGMVYSKDGKIIDNAIVEITDQSHQTIRATKTNKIGQFFLVTPLDKGSYFIDTEKDGFNFSTISMMVEDKIYPPLEIRSTN